MSVNAIEYIKNVGKSFGYASADYFKEGHTYTIHVFPYSDQGVVNRNKNNSVTFVSQRYVLYGCRVNKNDSNPATRVEYLENCDNANFEAAKMNYTSGIFEYGSWENAAAHWQSHGWY